MKRMMMSMLVLFLLLDILPIGMFMLSFPHGEERKGGSYLYIRE